MKNILLKLWQNTPWQIILLFFTAVFLWRNILFFLAGDDYAYAFIWNPEHGGNLMDGIGPREKISSVSDIFLSQWNHYLYWGGRTFSMLFIQLFAWQGKYLFNIANTIVFVLLILAIYFLALGKNASLKDNKLCLLWAIIGLNFGVLDYVTTMLWLTGACVYMWTGLFVCAFLLPYVFALSDKSFWQKPPLFAFLLMATAGLIAGWSEEGASLSMLFMLSIILYLLRKEKRITIWMKTGAFFSLVGCLFLMLCPGSIEREKFMLMYAADYVLDYDELFTAEMFAENFEEGFLPIVLWESFLFIPIFICLKNKLASEEMRRIILIFTAGALCVLTAMMFAPKFAIHTGFHSTVFLTVASVAALKECMPYLKEKYKNSKIWRKVMWILGSVSFIYGILLIVGALYVEISYNRQWAERMEYIEKHKNDSIIVVKSLTIPYNLDKWLGPRTLTEYHLIYGADLEFDPSDNRSIMFAQYYGLKKICIDTKTDWKKKKED